MTKKKSTKRALLMSFLSVLLCVSMLIGTTYAWFTDSVTSAGNVIKSGNLDVVMEWKDATATGAQQTYKDASEGAIFNYEKWEPGYVEAKNVRIHNDGSLALKYKLYVDPESDLTEDGVKLAKVIDVYFAEGEYTLASREMTELRRVGTLAEVLDGMPANMSGDLIAGETDKVTIALKMQESAGNEYQDKSIGEKFRIILVATQMEAEFDSFDKDYDADATYPLGKSDVAEKEYEDIGFKAVVEVPDEAPEGYYTLSAPKDQIIVDSNNGEGSLSFEMDLMRADDKTATPVKVENSGIAYPVAIQLPHPFLSVKEVIHNGEKVADFTYDPATQTLRFVTTHFSPFEIKYTDYTDPTFKLQYNKETLAIIGGMFVNKDPRELDASLKADDSKYTVTEFTKNEGKTTYYVVSEKATTVVVDPSEGSVELWRIISGLQSNEHSTVLLKHGEYTEGTTINVYSSMDIIGMGDTKDIKVIKAEGSSSSNRHLFNCNGTKADYIEVTLRNLTLDATKKTINSQDNAAVQSIRKSKVKCYDLDIIKGTGWDAVAFYVNGNNAVDGVKYPAYLYVENCTLNTTRSFGVVTTSGSYKFYHNDLKYGGTLYTTNSGSIKNTTMAAKDWNW